ncbi:zinc finger, RING/FYVE/PHD-type containing protein [Tanacetum coccineum]|uniref:Zinc finger, RING/FYVE/PHD-type containing protein n=1 Tax=Tanacetum coccineum TaxID=301880 RepID=A0ABQ5H309_9ASTR
MNPQLVQGLPDEPNGIEDKSVAMDSNINLESRSSVTISSRSSVLQACTTNSGFIALAGVLRSNAYHGTFDEDVIDHIPKVLEMLDLIKIPNVDTHRLRMKVFPLSLADDARQWWIDEGDGKITTWKELVEKIFCKFYPLSRDGEDEMLEEDESWNKEPINDIVSSDEEWEESNYGNPPNTTTESFFRPYLGTHDIEKVDKRSQNRHKGNDSKLEINILNKAPESGNKNNEQPNKRVCKAEKFEAIKYSLGPNEEYIAIKSCEYNVWEKGEDIEFETWYMQLIAGLVILISSSRFLLLKTWSDFVESSEASNQLVLTSLEPLDYAFVAFLPDISEELLFRGALLPLIGINLTSATVVAALFGILHLGSGQKFSFTTWTTFVGLAYGYAMILTSSLIVPMASNAINNLIGGVIWRINHQKREIYGSLFAGLMSSLYRMDSFKIKNRERFLIQASGSETHMKKYIYKEGAMMIDPSKTS